MKQQINEIKRMQQLAGILKENQDNVFDLDDFDEWDFSEEDEVTFIYDNQHEEDSDSWYDKRIKFSIPIQTIKDLLYNQSKTQVIVPIEVIGPDYESTMGTTILNKDTAKSIMDSYYGNYPEEDPENLN